MRYAMMIVGERDIPRSQWINIAPELAFRALPLNSCSCSTGKVNDDCKAGEAIWSMKSQMSLIWTRRSWVEESAHGTHLWRFSGIPAFLVVAFHHTDRASVSETIALIRFAWSISRLHEALTLPRKRPGTISLIRALKASSHSLFLFSCRFSSTALSFFLVFSLPPCFPPLKMRISSVGRWPQRDRCVFSAFSIRWRKKWIRMPKLLRGFSPQQVRW